MFDTDEVQQIPPDLDEMQPGPILAGFLSGIDVDRLSGYDQIVVLRAHQRMVSHYNAHLYADMAAVSDTFAEDDPLWAGESAAAEIRAALHLTRRTADNEYGYAIDVRQTLPRVWNALVSGRIDLRRAKTIIRGVEHLPTDSARAVVGTVIEEAPRLTTGQLAARIRRLCIEAEPDEAKKRYEDAVADRCIVAVPNPVGTTNLLGIDLPPHRVAAAMRHVNRLAGTLNTRTEPRTLDQIRADVALDLLCGAGAAGSSGARGVVDIRVDLNTLAELADDPGELAGYGPVIADIARQVAEDQPDVEWRFTVTDPMTGAPVSGGITRRRPTAGQRRAVESRNPTCVFPGCRMPSTGCDLNHRTPWSRGGSTTVHGLDPLCRHDHVLHHDCDWRYVRLPDGDYRWTSPLGHTYFTGGEPP